MQAQQSAAQYGIMYAGLVIVMLPTLILYICVQNKLTQGMTVGGLKGWWEGRLKWNFGKSTQNAE